MNKTNFGDKKQLIFLLKTMKLFNLLVPLTILDLFLFSTLAIAAQWQAHQDNKFVVTFDITQNGKMLNGSASHSNGTVSGKVTGIVNEQNWLDFTVEWNNNTKGRYTGHIDPDGFVRDGFTQDLKNLSSTAKWMTKTPVNIVGGGTLANPRQHCAADCEVCKREGLRCSNSGSCQEKYPTTAMWMCY